MDSNPLGPVVLVGQKKAIAIAVRNVSGRRRWSKLNEWLAAPAGSNQFPRNLAIAPITLTLRAEYRR
jgi:hypothetical protein